jgi:hypothetical protein
MTARVERAGAVQICHVQVLGAPCGVRDRRPSVIGSEIRYTRIRVANEYVFGTLT